MVVGRKDSGKVNHVPIGQREDVLISTIVSNFQITSQAKTGFGGSKYIK